MSAADVRVLHASVKRTIMNLGHGAAPTPEQIAAYLAQPVCANCRSWYPCATIRALDAEVPA